MLKKWEQRPRNLEPLSRTRDPGPSGPWAPQGETRDETLKWELECT